MDVELIEANNGGDLVKKPKDLSVIFGFQNMPYLGLFGGNKEASTPLKRLENEQAFDWWGNNLCFPNDSSVQLNSITEKTLETVALNSFGLKIIQKAVLKDLEFMKPFASVTASVSMISLDSIEISITLIRLDNLEQRTFIYIWDSTNKELTEK
jgi:hypothetical protein